MNSNINRSQKAISNKSFTIKGTPPCPYCDNPLLRIYEYASSGIIGMPRFDPETSVVVFPRDLK